jgi:hypothetical protein
MTIPASIDDTLSSWMGDEGEIFGSMSDLETGAETRGRTVAAAIAGREIANTGIEQLCIFLWFR